MKIGHQLVQWATRGIHAYVLRGQLHLVPRIAGSNVTDADAAVAKVRYDGIVGHLLAWPPACDERRNVLSKDDVEVLKVLGANPDTSLNLIADWLDVPLGRIHAIVSCTEGRELIAELRAPHAAPLVEGRRIQLLGLGFRIERERPSRLPGRAARLLREFLSEGPKWQSWLEEFICIAIDCNDEYAGLTWSDIEAAREEAGAVVVQGEQGQLVWFLPELQDAIEAAAKEPPRRWVEL